METLSARKVRAKDTRLAGPAPAGAVGHDLDRLDDGELLGLVRSLPRDNSRREAACELLVSRHRGLVRACVHRYSRSPEPTEDLMQVGYVGLLKAINNFNPAMGHSLAAYAQPCISGEIKRYFRDKRWHVHVERPVQELLLEVRSAARQMVQQLGHAPTEAELARHLGASEDDVREALRADMLMQPSSLDAPLAGQPDAATLADLLGAEDPQVEHTLSMEALAAHWEELPSREQKILLMRFYGDMTQADIGSKLGISQMHVSRLLAHALAFLRERILAPQDDDGAPELAASA
jgi:RNA polymerase sigma-B factor